MRDSGQREEERLVHFLPRNARRRPGRATNRTADHKKQKSAGALLSPTSSIQARSRVIFNKFTTHAMAYCAGLLCRLRLSVSSSQVSGTVTLHPATRLTGHRAEGKTDTRTPSYSYVAASYFCTKSTKYSVIEYQSTSTGGFSVQNARVPSTE